MEWSNLGNNDQVDDLLPQQGEIRATYTLRNCSTTITRLRLTHFEWNVFVLYLRNENFPTLQDMVERNHTTLRGSSTMST
jgi:hypothetical protein